MFFILEPELSHDGTFILQHRGYLTCRARNTAATLLRKCRANTTVMVYLDTRGPAIHMITRIQPEQDD